MTTSASSSPNIISRLQHEVQAKQEEIERLHRLMARKEAQWEATKQSFFEQFRLAIECQFGSSTEKYRVEQGDILSTRLKWPWMRKTPPMPMRLPFRAGTRD